MGIWNVAILSIVDTTTIELDWVRHVWYYLNRTVQCSQLASMAVSKNVPKIQWFRVSWTFCMFLTVDNLQPFFYFCDPMSPLSEVFQRKITMIVKSDLGCDKGKPSCVLCWGRVPQFFFGGCLFPLHFLRLWKKHKKRLEEKNKCMVVGKKKECSSLPSVIPCTSATQSWTLESSRQSLSFSSSSLFCSSTALFTVLRSNDIFWLFVLSVIFFW